MEDIKRSIVNSSILSTLLLVPWGALSQIPIDDFTENKSTVMAITKVGLSARDLPEDPQSTIDVMVYYQPTYARVLGSHQAVVERVRYLYNAVQTLHYEEGFGVTYRIVAITPTVSVPDDLAMYPDDPNVVGADQLASRVIGNLGNPEYDTRLLYKPDIVTYIREYTNEPRLGTAASETDANDLGIEGFYASNTVLDQFTDNTIVTLAHELGHNYGAGHEAADNPNSGDPRNRAWNCGGEYSVMHTLQQGSHWFYSNPDKTHNGEVCGDENEADNHAVIEQDIGWFNNFSTATTAVGTVGFSSTDIRVSEGNAAMLTVVRDGDLSETARVTVMVTSQTAEYNVDYTDGFYELVFEAGEDTKQVAVNILEDGIQETDEVLTASLVFPARMTPQPEGDEASITIEGNAISGNAGTFSLPESLLVTEGNSGTFTVERTGGSDAQVMVDVTTTFGSASGEDFVAINESLIFEVGETVKELTLETINDEIEEGVETATISISSAANVDNADMSVTIDDDDGVVNKGQFSVSVSASTISEGSAVDVTVTRSGGTGEAVMSLLADFSNGTADATHSLTFGDEERQKTVSITATDNSTDEANYMLTISLSSTDEGVTFGNNEVSVTVTDNDTAPVTPPSNSDGGSGGGSAWYLLAISFAGLFRKLAK